MVGGSGLYADSVINGIDHFPNVKNSIKKEVNSLLEEQGIDKLISMLGLIKILSKFIYPLKGYNFFYIKNNIPKIL